MFPLRRCSFTAAIVSVPWKSTTLSTSFRKKKPSQNLKMSEMKEPYIGLRLTRFRENPYPDQLI
jgi:hypothetical protein